MRLSLAPLLSIQVSHEYHGGPCGGLAFGSLPETERLLRGSHLRARVSDGRLDVYFEADGSGAPRAPLPAATLRFGLRSTDPNLYNYTRADALPPRGFVAVYRNQASSVTLDRVAECRLVGAVFSHALQSGTRPVDVALVDAAGTTLRAVSVRDVARAAVSYDLTDVAPGRLTVRESVVGATPADTPYQYQPELLSEGAFGVVEVALASGFAAAPPRFELRLAAKRETLRYYVVARRFLAPDLAQLNVVDAGAVASALTFDRVLTPDPARGDLPASALAEPDATVVLFRSTAEVARQAAPRARLSLRRNGTELVANLPSAPPDRPDAHMIVHVSK